MKIYKKYYLLYPWDLSNAHESIFQRGNMPEQNRKYKNKKILCMRDLAHRLDVLRVLENINWSLHFPMDWSYACAVFCFHFIYFFHSGPSSLPAFKMAARVSESSQRYIK